MKKILFLIPTLSGGGAEKVLINLVNSLDKSKYEVSVQTIFDTGIHRQELGQDVTYLPGIFKKQFRGNIYFLKLFSPKALFRLFIKKQYDIIVSFLEGPTARIVSGCDVRGTKLVCWIHVEQQNIKRASRSFRNEKEALACYRKFDQIVCVAETVKKDFQSLFDVKVPIRILYNINDTKNIIKRSQESFDDLVFSKDQNIISVGRLMTQKGYDRLIRVHKRLLDEGLPHQIYIAGEGPERKHLESLITAYGVKQTFHLIGFKENPYKYMKMADFFVCSSNREGFSTVVTECLILGIPVVTCRCSGMTELLGEENEYGLIVPNDEDGLYSGMKLMLREPEILKKYREKSFERGILFSENNIIKELDIFFDSL